jgi:hypothetical protein
MYKFFIAAALAALCLFAAGCSGGFDGDSDGADGFAPAVFDTAKT